MTRRIKISDQTMAELHTLADQGTKESIKEIERIIESAKNDDEKGIAMAALSEARFHYYCPENEEEEHDYELCGLIAKHENVFYKNIMELENLERDLLHAKLNEEVHAKVMEKTKKEEWKYNCIPDIALIIESRMSNIKKEIVYDEEWIAQAKFLVKAEKYKENLSEVLEFISEDIDFEEDDDYDDYDDDCDCRDCMSETY